MSPNDCIHMKLFHVNKTAVLSALNVVHYINIFYEVSAAPGN